MLQNIYQSLPQTEMIRSNGYAAEEHQVTTSDGYILTMHRIPNDQNSSNCSKSISCVSRGPVLLQHGLLSSSADYLVTGPENGLPYLLSDAGYDVWMGNFRGNTHSRKHIKMSPHQRVFWDFSWHEMGVIDLPHMIDYILNQTKEESLHYVGHSQGTTTFFVLCSTRPEYNSKIRGAHLLAPAAYMSNMVSPLIRILAPLSSVAELALNMVGSGELLANGDLLSVAGESTCKLHAVTTEVCSNILFLLFGFNGDQFNLTLLPEILKRTPAGASVRQILHYVQAVTHRRFCQYDHGSYGNMRRYGRADPPDYNLENVTAPVYLYYGDNDWLVSMRDVKRLKKVLRSIKFKYLVPYPGWNHMDFIWAKDIKEILNDMVIENIRKSDGADSGNSIK